MSKLFLAQKSQLNGNTFYQHFISWIYLDDVNAIGYIISVLGHFKLNDPKKKTFSIGDWALVQNAVYIQN